MLRNALLLQLHNGAYEWLKERTTFEPLLKQAISATHAWPECARRCRQSSKFEIMGTRVGLAEPAHPVPSYDCCRLDLERT